ncbi:MAG: hypothetical protein IJ341_08415 [Bacteroidales bacterium]|nr:hypothetical protein [Bacteroidales bacterium]
MKQLKHYASIIAMLMLLSQITFTSCSEDFGPDIDKLKEDVSTLQNTVADLQKAYEGGKIITNVSPITTSQGGWQITFSDESTINLYNGANGANGSNGEDGANGVTPYIKIDTNSNWTVSYDNGETYTPITDASGNPVCARGKDGTNGISVAVRENSEGNYEIIGYLDDKDNPLTVLSTPYSSNPSNQIASIVENSDQGTVVITMSSGAEYKFVQKIIYPTSIIILTDEIFVDEEEGIAEIEFRINPSNARIDKDNIIVDQIRESYLKSYASSYTNPTPNYEIVSLNNSVNTEGEQLQGQYKLTIKHKGAQGRYEEICVLVISTLDSGNNPIEISSEKFYISSEIPCNVTVTASEGGTAEVDKTKVFPNKEVILTATPNEGFRFVNWTLNGVEVSKENPYTATVTANSVYVANFEVLPTNNVHAYVDLGLSVKWATCNVGADSPEEYGDYFAWGETTPKTTYDWSTYKYCNGTYDSMTKYCTSSSYGTVDNKTTLELSDDAAHVNWGGSWRMPTKAEQDELRNTDNCTWTWTTQNGVNGYKVTSNKNGNSIFLPAAGYRNGSNLSYAGSRGDYWSSSLGTSGSYSAYDVVFSSGYVLWRNYYRYFGRSVRAVCE